MNYIKNVEVEEFGSKFWVEEMSGSTKIRVSLMLALKVCISIQLLEISMNSRPVGGNIYLIFICFSRDISKLWNHIDRLT